MNKPSVEELIYDKGKPKRHRSASAAELYAVLEALLPFAAIEIDLLADFVREFPEDKDHAEDIERVRLGGEAISRARWLISRKSANIRRKQQALTKKHGIENA